MNKILIFFLITNLLSAHETFTKKDSLHGGLSPERVCFDVQRYDLNIKINPEDKSIIGYNDITFLVNSKKVNKIQLDLFENMKIDSIIFQNKKLTYKREFNAVFVEFPFYLYLKSENKLRFYYSGNPVIAKRAPWDGGFVFNKDASGKPWKYSAEHGVDDN